MKTLKLLLAATLLFSAFFHACKKDGNTSPCPSASSIIEQGNWRISLYNDNGIDKTTYFSGYIFSFYTNGTVRAVKQSSTVNGSWSTLMDDSQQKLVLDFGATLPFNELNNDWHIVEQTSFKLRLEDVSGSGGGTELLIFERN